MESDMTAIVTAPPRPAAGGRRIRTRWFRVRCGGYEPLYTAAGESLGDEFVTEIFHLEVPNTFLGLGTRDRIFAAAAERCPGKDVLEFEALSSAPADEF
ncbi:hypothetical protein C7293_13785 [filamentous cyanobacterium CCT1]|nr:hypothetical protein C7293_13785 [filamentous cyanobacterium CCT1]PSN80393.1 hypothetical protein C8B47_06715 [filamentous cyanobacterium CCP4]